MKFTCSVIINQPVEKTVALFSNPDHLKEYQDGFLRKDLISGQEGQEGAVSNMYYKMGKREMEITETIVTNNLPDEFFGRYHHKHMDNTMKCWFEAIDTNTTHYHTEIHYTAFRGLLPKLMATLFPGMFRKQVQKWLNNFKVFAEKN